MSKEFERKAMYQLKKLNKSMNQIWIIVDHISKEIGKESNKGFFKKAFKKD